MSVVDKSLDLLSKAKTFLFVPANRTDRISKAFATGADCVITDFEDAVAPTEKEEARKDLHKWLSENPNKQILVRVNAFGTPWHADDLNFCQHPQVFGIVLPKAESVENIKEIRVLTQKNVLPIIETPLGIKYLDEIASSEGVVRLLFGKLDLAVELGLNPDESDPNELVFLPYRAAIVTSSAIAKIAQPVDGVYTDINNVSGLKTYVKRAKDSGFSAILLIHPKQIEVVEQTFSPTEEEILWAKRVVELVSEGGGAAVSLDGKMVDAPVFLRASRILNAIE